MGSFTPWRDAGKFGPAAGIPFGADGFTPADGEENPRARLRIVAPDFFHVMGVPLVSGRDFTPEDRRENEAGRDRQPEPRPAAVSKRRSAQSQGVVDRSVLRPKAFPAPHRRHRRRRRRRADCARTGDDGLSPVRADGRSRAVVRACIGRSVLAGAAGDADRPGPVGQPAGRARGDARRCARRSARARAPQRVRVLGIRRRCAADRGRRRRRRAGVWRQRADA